MEYDKPIPSKTAITAPFWEGLNHNQFLLQKCTQCSKYLWYPRAWCIYCGNRDLVWSPSKGKGKVFSFVIIRQVVENLPSWSKEIPFVVVELDLDEGVRVYGKVNLDSLDQIHIGDPAEILFDKIAPEVTLFSFKLSKTS
jgi:uncharacterized OB-fold protein